MKKSKPLRDIELVRELLVRKETISVLRSDREEHKRNDKKPLSFGFPVVPDLCFATKEKLCCNKGHRNGRVVSRL